MERVDGAGLARAWSADVVEPLIARTAPTLRFGTARIGTGSDVLGLDDLLSRDHDWGLRLTVVVPAEAVQQVHGLLERELPAEFAGRPVRFPTTWDPAAEHRVEVTTIDDLVRSRTGLDASGPLDLVDWLSLTGQSALELIAGPVFRDETGELGAARDRLAALPEDVRRWSVASAWAKVAEELPFVGRTAERGDDTGSRVIAARLVQTSMRLGFLLEGRWAPYSKWLGTAFAALPAAGAATALLHRAVAADTWRDREEALTAALDAFAGIQADAGLPSLSPATEPFWDRPYRGVRDVAGVVRESIEDAALRAAPLVGTPELWTDDVRLLTDHAMRRRIARALLGLDHRGR